MIGVVLLRSLCNFELQNLKFGSMKADGKFKLFEMLAFGSLLCFVTSVSRKNLFPYNLHGRWTNMFMLVIFPDKSFCLSGCLISLLLRRKYVWVCIDQTICLILRPKHCFKLSSIQFRLHFLVLAVVCLSFTG